MLISLKQLLDHAAENNYAVPAFNINNMEQIHAIISAANQVNSPIIFQISVNAIKYAGIGYLESLIYKSIKMNPKIPICIHQDHGPTPDFCYKSIQLGYSSVMIDGSLKPDMKTPASFSYNIEVSRKTVEVAHACGVSVEGEIGCLGSIESGLYDKNILLTDCNEAKIFVKETKVDALAIAIGTSHGAYKFKKPPSKDTLSIETVRKIHAVLPSTHLVIHGASEVSQEIIEIINENGGDIPETYGVPISEIKKIISHGVRKINIDTDLRLAYTASIRKFLQNNKSVFDMRKYNNEAIKYMKKICIERFEAFGSSGHASNIRPIELNNMAKLYNK